MSNILSASYVPLFYKFKRYKSKLESKYSFVMSFGGVLDEADWLSPFEDCDGGRQRMPNETTDE